MKVKCGVECSALWLHHVVCQIVRLTQVKLFHNTDAL